MKQIIRHKAFESNSSSSHCFGYYINDEDPESIIRERVDGRNRIDIHLNGEYGWDYDKFEDFESLIEYYILQQISYRYGDKKQSRIEEVKNEIQTLLTEVCGRPIRVKVFDGDGYIDHQSVGMNIKSREDLVNYLAKGFIYTSNDNDDYDNLPDYEYKPLGHYG